MKKDKSIIIAANFNTLISTTDKTTGQKVIKNGSTEQDHQPTVSNQYLKKTPTKPSAQ